MKQKTKQIVALIVLMSVMLILAACGDRMSQEEIETMKIDQTIGQYMDGYAKQDAVQILNSTNLQENDKQKFQLILDQLLNVLHRDPYTIKVAYQINDAQIQENTAEIQLSAILRIFKEGEEMGSIRLFDAQNLQLIKNADGEWKINFKQFIPEELLNFSFLF